MAKDTPETFYLKDYTPFGYDVESVHLTFRLTPETTRVISKIRFAPNRGRQTGPFSCMAKI